MNYFTWTPLELGANFFTLLCIILAGRNSIHTWWTGLVGCTLFGFMFYSVQLYADATLQVFFFVTGIYGWLMWSSQGTSSTKELEISYASKSYMLTGLGIAVVVAIGYGYMLHSLTDAYAPWIDSTVLTLSVLGQLLLMNKNIQTWQVWIMVNTLSVPLFWSRELYLTSILYSGFWINAVYSYYNWLVLMRKQNE